MFIKLGSIIAGIGLFVAGLFGYHQVQQPSFGAYNPTGGGTYRLQSSIGTSDTSITLSSFKEPISAIPYTMSYLNSTIEYGTIEPGSSTKKEFVSFTGITQNSDGTATLTGVTRGLGFSYPYTASTTLQENHSGQSIFILSNPPQLTNQYLNKNNNDEVEGVVTFTVPPILNDANATSSSQAASRSYVTSVAFGTTPIQKSSGGTGASGFSTGGFLYDSGSGTALSASSSPTIGWLHATSTSAISYFDGQVIHNGSTTFDGINSFDNATSTFNATTTFSATTGSPVQFNGVQYKFPSTQGASSTVLATDGNGNLTPYTPMMYSYTPILSAGATTTANTGFLNSNTTGYVGLFTIPETIVVNNVTIKCISGVGSDTYNLALFSEDGLTRLFNVTSGTVSVSSATTTTAVSGVRINPGNYYFVVQPVTGTNNTLESWSGFTMDIAGKNRVGRITGLTAGTMPSTITPANIINNGTTDAVVPVVFRLDN